MVRDCGKRGIASWLALSVATAQAAPIECSFRAEGEDVFIECTDGSYFEAPRSGGVAFGFDRRGRPLSAEVRLTDGRYSIFIEPQF
jgi:hypothetical protein